MDDQQIIETLKSSFLFNFRTGNVMLDTFVTGLIIMLATYVFNMFNNVFKNCDWTNMFTWYTTKNQAKIVISGKKLQGTDSTRLEYSTNFFAILYQIKKLDCVKSDIHELSEIPIQEPTEVSYCYDDDSDDDKETEKTSKGMGTNLIVSQTTPFKMNDDVYGYVNINKDSEGNEKNPVKTEEFQITLYSETLNADELRTVLQNWVKEYESRLNSDNEKHLKYFLYTPSGDAMDDYYDATSHYSEFKFESGKSFSNVFYPEKEDIVKRIDFFTNNKAWYKKCGIPYTMGFMFYGEPGCGKTSTIKAIANHTQRHIVSIPLNKIKTAKELLNVFYNVQMNYKDIPLHQRLYVLEDIDAADLKNVVGERSDKDTKDADKDGDKNGSKEETEDSGIDMNLLNMLKSSAAFDKKTSRLTLATLLEVLDGVMEMDGRMLIITTNYPEKLDKALIRPGRIDMKVCFGPMTSKNILEMFEFYFETDVPSEFDTSLLPDLKWTPAEVTQVFLNNMPYGRSTTAGQSNISSEYSSEVSGRIAFI
jgi:SpoVK/Ycf46/Vps4 family AAA+-type ATPase